MKEKNLSIKDAVEMRQLLFLPGGFELHIGMFIPSILSQGTPEQQATWLPLCMDLRIIGTYAQTELGHGTFLRGLETVAVYDPETTSFVIHSPTVTSTKWWPGGLGKTATHVILMARLLTQGKDYGPHAFIVQIRDLQTHLPLPGVQVGEIGPKMGYNGVDNGWLQFDHVCIPRENMLMRYSKVEKDGTYVAPPPENSKASYATMVYVRATIVRDAGDFLGRAVTIATRYAAVRRQSSPGQNGRELQILDYDNIQQTLIPLISKTFALKFMGKYMMDSYDQFTSDRDKNDFTGLPELHAMSSGLKAFCTDTACGGIEQSRRSCGGQGYSVLSGLPTLYTSYVQNVTWEGDNSVMYLQMSRYLLKSLLQRKMNVESTRYLFESEHVCSVSVSDDWRNHDVVIHALEATARYLTKKSIIGLQDPQGRILFEGSKWNANTMELIKMAESHCRVIVQRCFVRELSLAASNPLLQKRSHSILEIVCSLHGLVMLMDAGAVLLESGYVTAEQSAMLRHEARNLTRLLRPNALALVDSYGYEDYLLNSAIGKKDGDVYNNLLNAARYAPFNATEEGPGWKPVLQTLLDPTHRSKL